MAIAPALIGGAAALGVGGLQASVASGNTAATNLMNEDIAQKQMNFQEDMSNTAFQRMSADARAARINPLAVVGGGGASTPSGAGIAAQNPNLDQAFTSIGQSANQAQAASNVFKQGKILDRQMELLDANTQKTLFDGQTSSAKAAIAKNAARVSDALQPYQLDQAKRDFGYSGTDAILKRIGSGGGVVNSALKGATMLHGVFGGTDENPAEGLPSGSRNIDE